MTKFEIVSITTGTIIFLSIIFGMTVVFPGFIFCVIVNNNESNYKQIIGASLFMIFGIIIGIKIFYDLLNGLKNKK